MDVTRQIGRNIALHIVRHVTIVGGKKGHFQRKCLSKKNQQKDNGNKQSLVEDENADVDSVSIEENAGLMHIVVGVTKNIHGG